MKKIIFPIILAVLLPVILWQANPNLEVAGIVLTAGIGLAIGAVINKIVFKKKDEEAESKEEVES